MLVGKIIIFISVVSLMKASNDFHFEEHEKGESSKIVHFENLRETVDVSDEYGDYVEISRDSNEEILHSKEIEADIKAWINHLDCLKTPMGALRCFMIKKATDNFYKNPKREYTKLKERFKFFVNDLRQDGHVDKDLEVLLKKYGKFLDK